MTFAIPLQVHLIWHPKDDSHCRPIAERLRIALTRDSYQPLVPGIGIPAIGAVFPADAGRQFLPSIADDVHHPPVRGEGDAAQRLSAIGRGARRTGCVLGGGVEQFPGTYDGWHPVISKMTGRWPIRYEATQALVAPHRTATIAAAGEARFCREPAASP
jgi:hypothetical protein